MKTLKTMLCDTSIEFAVIMLNGKIMFEGHVRDLNAHCGIRLLKCECKIVRNLMNVVYIELNEESFYDKFLNR